MSDQPQPSDLSLFVDILHTLEAIIALGQPTADFWSAVKQAARQEADRYGEA